MICDFSTGEMPTHWESQDCPYLLGDLLVLLGATLQAAAASSGVLLHRSQYTALKPAAHGIFLLARCRSEPLSRHCRSGAAKRDTYRSLHHFVGICRGRGGFSRSSGRKEMGILRLAGLEGLLFGDALRGSVHERWVQKSENLGGLGWWRAAHFGGACWWWIQLHFSYM